MMNTTSKNADYASKLSHLQIAPKSCGLHGVLRWLHQDSCSVSGQDVVSAWLLQSIYCAIDISKYLGTRLSDQPRGNFSNFRLTRIRKRKWQLSNLSTVKTVSRDGLSFFGYNLLLEFLGTPGYTAVLLLFKIDVLVKGTGAPDGNRVWCRAPPSPHG